MPKRGVGRFHDRLGTRLGLDARAFQRRSKILKPIVESRDGNLGLKLPRKPRQGTDVVAPRQGDDLIRLGIKPQQGRRALPDRACGPEYRDPPFQSGTGGN